MATLRRLLALGAHVDRVDSRGCTPLFTALQRHCDGQLDVVRLLLTVGADVNRQTEQAVSVFCVKQNTLTEICRGSTALHVLCRLRKDATEERQSLAQLLLSFGADTTAVDGDGKRPSDHSPLPMQLITTASPRLCRYEWEFIEDAARAIFRENPTQSFFALIRRLSALLDTTIDDDKFLLDLFLDLRDDHEDGERRRVERERVARERHLQLQAYASKEPLSWAQIHASLGASQCPLCAARFSRQTDYCFCRPDGDIEAKTWSWYLGNFFGAGDDGQRTDLLMICSTCSTYGKHLLPRPWGDDTAVQSSKRARERRID